MMKYIIVLLFSLLFTQCKKEVKIAETKQESITKSIDINIEDFIGTWEYIDNPNNEDIPYGVYTIEIEKKDNQLIGKYCAIAQKGNKIDCSSESEYNLDIIYIDNYLSVNFYSFFGAKEGNAKITLANNILSWRIIKEPIEGEFYIPKMVDFTSKVLQKKESLINNNQYSFKEIYNTCKEILLPYDYSYDEIITLPNYISFTLTLSDFKELDNFKVAKLNFNNDSKLLLLSGLQESGNQQLYLLSLDNNYETLDRLLLYENKEIEINDEYGTLSTTLKIGENNIITILKHKNSEGNSELISSIKYTISNKGLFVNK